MFRLLLALTVFAAFHAPWVAAQTPNFSGTWILDADTSHTTPDAGLGALGAVGTVAPSCASGGQRYIAYGTITRGGGANCALSAAPAIWFSGSPLGW